LQKEERGIHSGGLSDCGGGISGAMLDRSLAKALTILSRKGRKVYER
jgi:hypothetical protein